MAKRESWLFIVTRTSAPKGINGYGSGNGYRDGDGSSGQPEGVPYYPWSSAITARWLDPLLHKKEDSDA
jgi:hypothetical protein